MRRLTRWLLAVALAAPASAAVFRPSPLPADLPTLHFVLAPMAALPPSSLATAALASILPAAPTLPVPAVPAISAAVPAVAAAVPGAAAAAEAPPAPAAALRLPVRAALEAAGASLAAVPPGGVKAAQALGALFEAAKPGIQHDSGDAAFLAIRHASDAKLLDRAMETARQSVTGRRVLDEAEKALAGKPLPVQVRDLGRNLGEYDYVAGVLRVDRKVLSGDPRQAAATIVHELVHVLQHREGIPAEALEMELEAHLASIDVSRELGIPLTSFEAAAAKALAKSPRAYVDFIADQLPGKVRLAYSDMASVRAQLAEEVEDLENADRVSAERLWWARRDLKLVKSKKGRAAYEAFAKRVLALVEARAGRATSSR